MASQVIPLVKLDHAPGQRDCRASLQSGDNGLLARLPRMIDESGCFYVAHRNGFILVDTHLGICRPETMQAVARASPRATRRLCKEQSILLPENPLFASIGSRQEVSRSPHLDALPSFGGRGVRVGMFELTDDGCQLLRWLKTK